MTVLAGGTTGASQASPRPPTRAPRGADVSHNRSVVTHTTANSPATRANGWLPLLGSPTLAATTRTAHIGSLDDLAERLSLLRDLAGERFAQLCRRPPGRPDRGLGEVALVQGDAVAQPVQPLEGAAVGGDVTAVRDRVHLRVAGGVAA